MRAISTMFRGRGKGVFSIEGFFCGGCGDVPYREEFP